METKTCPHCKLELPLNSTYFASRYDRKQTIFQHICRTCQSKYRKKHYKENKQKYIDKAKVFTKSMSEWFIEYKKNLKCKLCGEDRYWVLDFHHIDPKEKDLEVSILIRKGNKNKILKEIEKCNVLCANCHRDLHFKQQHADFA